MITAAEARELTEGKTLAHFVKVAEKEVKKRAADGYSSASVQLPDTVLKTVMAKLVVQGFIVTLSEKLKNTLSINW